MLNISPSSVRTEINPDDFSALKAVEERRTGRLLIRVTTVLILVGLIILFLPWTQNIRTFGAVTTLKPDQRPQTLHSVIPGRIEAWFVQEGDFVKKGDTILFISEVKEAYFDPQLLDRTEDQLSAKQQAVTAYQGKVNALENQIDALEQTAKLKLQQVRNELLQAGLKVESDSIDYQAAVLNFEIAQEQFQRIESLYEDGLKSLTELENRKRMLQQTQAEKIAAQNKLLTSRNEAPNAEVEVISIQAQYQDEVAKAASDKFTALSNRFDAEATVTKLENEYMNYSIRSGMYFITAPLDGYITQALQSGIGETIKDGVAIASIMPARIDLAVEMFVEPIDMPLLEKGQSLRIQFDGWPAIVFSGWPQAGFGTYSGKIFAIDNFISKNGKYRVLVAPDPNEAPWPTALRVGAGTNNLILLKDVPIWYELWRQINGFPPDYYKPESSPETSNQKK